MIATPHFRIHPEVDHLRFTPQTATSYLPTNVAKCYGFPTGDGRGQAIALIELGGGYRLTDLVPGSITIHTGQEVAGFAGIPVRDEVRLEKQLTGA